VSPSRHILTSNDRFELLVVEQLRPLARAFIDLALQLMAEEKMAQIEYKEAA
jgi:hypothetical protein